MPEVVTGRVFTLEGVTTVRVTVLVGCEVADAAGLLVVVAPVAAGRVMVVVAVAGVASVLAALVGLSMLELFTGFSGTRLLVGWLLPLTGLRVFEGS